MSDEINTVHVGGPRGLRGPQGERGPKGDTGPTGPRGLRGPKSSPGRLTDFTDVVINSAQNGDILYFNGSIWTNGAGSGGSPVDLSSYATKTYVTQAIGGVSIPSDISDLTDTGGLLSSSSFSGSYNDLTNKPTIPADISDLTDTGGLLNNLGGGGGTQIQSDWAQINNAAVDFIKNKPAIPNLGLVAEHILPTADVTYDLGSATKRFRDLYLSTNTVYLGETAIGVDPVKGLQVKTFGGGEGYGANWVEWTTDNKITFSGVDIDHPLYNYLQLVKRGDQIKELPQPNGYAALVVADFLVTVTAPAVFSTPVGNLVDATIEVSAGKGSYQNNPTGAYYIGYVEFRSNPISSYNDLTNKPTIPTNLSDLNNDIDALTPSTVGQFIPDNLSEFTNDAGFITLSDVPASFSGNYADLTGAPTIPADVSDLTDTNSLLGSGSGSTTHMGNNDTFMDVDLDEDIVRMQTTNTDYIADYTFNSSNSGFTSATWENGGIVIAGPSVDVYTAVWALTQFSTITLTVGGVDYEITNTGSSTPGHPQDVTLWTDTTPPTSGPLTVDNIYIVIRNGVESYIEVDGSDVRISAADDVRIYSNDTFELVNRSTTDPIQITVNDNNASKTWSFQVDGNLQLPDSGTIVDSNGNNLLSSSGGTTLPADANGYLNNDGSGTLTWVPGNPSGSGLLPYNAVTVVSNTTTADWTEFTLSGTMDSMWDYNNTVAPITLSNQSVYGRTATPNTKNMWVIDAKVNSSDYLVVEFPDSPTPGDVFTVTSIVITQTVNAGSFVIGETYTITSVGTTDWMSIGAQYSGLGQTFVATGAGSGTGTASTATGAKKLIFKPASGFRARTMNTGQNGPVVFGQGGTYDFMFLDLASQNVNSPMTWAYAGLVDGIPTWYHTYF